MRSISAEPSFSELKSMREDGERRIPDIANGVLKGGVRKKNDNLGVVNSFSSKCEFAHLLSNQVPRTLRHGSKKI